MAEKRWSLVVGLAPLFWILPAFSQTNAWPLQDNQANKATSCPPGSKFCGPAAPAFGTSADSSSLKQRVVNAVVDFATEGSRDRASQPGGNSKVELAIEKTRPTLPDDFNRHIYYRNKLEFSLDGGWLPINIPFPFDFMMGADYNTYPLKYTLLPVIASLRWQLGNVGGPRILRGNWDVEFSGAIIAIPRGPETRYLAYLMGMRRNFVSRNWRAAPYFDWRVGIGNIDAKGPLGVPYAQGQNLTFTLNLGSGLRYNFDSRCGISLGLNWMHISNANLSQGKPPNWGVRNYGINVYGPIVGIDMQLRKRRIASE